MELTKNQIDRLGQRLKAGVLSDDVWRDLDLYRGSFADELERVVNTVRETLKIQPAARIKLSQSIIEKLRRGTTQLSRMQDIAGCRVIVEDIIAQDRAVEVLEHVFSKAKFVDRRKHPSHGYRAMHVIVTSHEMSVEIQVRTILQHLWAEFSERVADRVNPAIKYGGGPDWVQVHLVEMARVVAEKEGSENELAEKLKGQGPETTWSEELRNQIRQARHDRRLRDYDMPWQFNKRFLRIVMDQLIMKG